MAFAVHCFISVWGMWLSDTDTGLSLCTRTFQRIPDSVARSGGGAEALMTCTK